MVFDALDDITRHFGVEKPDGQFHQLDQEIADERDVDARADV